MSYGDIQQGIVIALLLLLQLASEPLQLLLSRR
jgi:hypothetical protein